MNDKPKVFANDPIQIANENRHHAVHTAIDQFRSVPRVVDPISGQSRIDPHLRALHFELALDALIKSVQKCSHLDNRPLDVDRVHARHLAVLALLHGGERSDEVA